MSQLNEALRESRKRRGMTQEQLAERVHVSRQTISNWETGRASPDYEMLKTLSDELETPLTALLGVEEPAPDEQPPQTPDLPEEAQLTAAPEEGQEQPRPARRRRWWSIPVVCVLAAALGMACLALVSWWRARPVPPPYPREWFMEEQAAVEGQAHLTASVLGTPVEPVMLEEGRQWDYQLIVREDNGVGFTIDKWTRYGFLSNGGHTVTITPIHEIAAGSNRHYLSGHSVRMYRVCMTSLSPIEGEGFLLEGTDDNGNRITVRCYVPYLPDAAE